MNGNLGKVNYKWVRDAKMERIWDVPMTFRLKYAFLMCSIKSIYMTLFVKIEGTFSVLFLQHKI